MCRHSAAQLRRSKSMKRVARVRQVMSKNGIDSGSTASERRTAGSKLFRSKREEDQYELKGSFWRASGAIDGAQGTLEFLTHHLDEFYKISPLQGYSAFAHEGMLYASEMLEGAFAELA